ncbi:glycosyltransferase [Ferruginibacter sp. SUN002]|uniref:glycosyltransferase n=1 Tax=Ferruginibacter sp. SUN002 TaxID=2937789 RepID=UPI003D35AA26
MLVSIIIPAYNRERIIVQTLKSLTEIDFPKDQFEIFVCDNNSKDNTAKVVKEFIEVNKEYNITYLFEERQGVHYARNATAKKANGKYLYFTDDDMIADKAIIKELLFCFEWDEKVGVATGIVLPKWEETPPSWVLKHCANYLLSLNDPSVDFVIDNNDCGIFSCHQMIRKDVFFLSGGFNPENTEGKWIGDGEAGLNMKIKQLAFKFALNRKSVIYHIIPKERLTQDYLDKRMMNEGNCHSYAFYRAYKPSIKRLLYGMIAMSYKMISLYTKSIWLKIRGNDYWHLRRAKSFYWLARIKYDYKLCRDVNWKALVLKSNWLEEA